MQAHEASKILDLPREGEKLSKAQIGIFWPGDYRSKPNELAQPNAEEARVELERARRNSAALSHRRFSHETPRSHREAWPGG